jgi:hypothetical protein
MFVGHLSLALAAKRAEPRASLGWYVAAVTALDLLWPIFLLAGLEQVRIAPGAMAFTPLVFESYPWSHSLVMAVAWGLLLAGLVRGAGVTPRAMRLLPWLVVSHWILDFITHAPDLPLAPGLAARFGLGLWNSLTGTYVVEGGMWLAGIAVFLGVQPRLSRTGLVAFWSMTAITTVMWAAGPFGPVPPDVRSLAGFALVGWIVVPWAILADRRVTAA